MFREMQMTADGNTTGGGLGEKALDTSEDRDLGGTGGSAGGGTLAGRGDTAGGEGDADERGAIGTDMSDATGTTAALVQLAGRTDSQEAAEAAALGNDDGALADAAGADALTGQTIG